MDFARRSSEIEIMDDLSCSGEVVSQTLKELEFINKWLGGNAVTLSAMSRIVRHREQQELSVAELGCGGGDMLKLIYYWAKAKGIPVKLTGVDANPNIIKFAQGNLHGLPDVNFFALDIFSETFKALQFDVVVATLFFHHFDNATLVSFFKQLKGQVRKAIVINDIHRHPLAFYSIRWLTSLFSRSMMVKHDAPLSVMRAFHRRELEAILRSAGMENYSIRWKWAFRWQVVVHLDR
jgi:SAM-dependent methyltransferase